MEQMKKKNNVVQTLQTCVHFSAKFWTSSKFQKWNLLLSKIVQEGVNMATEVNEREVNVGNMPIEQLNGLKTQHENEIRELQGQVSPPL
jgi:hypothetical protein